MDLASKIEQRSARIAVMGLGYVGLPLAVAFAEAGFPTVGIEINADRVATLMKGESYIGDVPHDKLSSLVQAGTLQATADSAELARVDVIIICVPSPLQHNKAPDLSLMITAAEQISHFIKPGQLIILQSTTYPGTTEEDILPILEKSGLNAGVDFNLAFSPERINPGDREHSVSNTPKVVGGLTPTCGQLARILLASTYPQVHMVSSPRAAEMTKLLENTFRAVNIALVNEMAMLCERMGMDIWEVIAAASTKPFGYMPFYPGPGVGGHCIPVDPFFLLWKAREFDFHTKFIELAAEINEAMPYHTVGKVVEALNSRGKSARGSKLLVLGVTYKADVEDARNTPASRFIELLLAMGAAVSYCDPYVLTMRLFADHRVENQPVLSAVDLTDEEIRSSDCVIIMTPHSVYDLKSIVSKACLVVDTCNATRAVAEADHKVFRLGVGQSH